MKYTPLRNVRPGDVVVDRYSSDGAHGFAVFVVSIVQSFMKPPGRKNEIVYDITIINSCGLDTISPHETYEGFKVELAARV